MKNLLLVIAFPEDEPHIEEWDDADMYADALLAVLNEERKKNAEDAGRPEYYKPLMLNAIPGPQWVDGQGLAILLRAVRLVQLAQKDLDE